MRYPRASGSEQQRARETGITGDGYRWRCCLGQPENLYSADCSLQACIYVHHVIHVNYVKEEFEWLEI